MKSFAVPNDGEAVATNPVHRGLDNRQRDRCSECGIDRIATAGKCSGTRL